MNPNKVYRLTWTFYPGHEETNEEFFWSELNLWLGMKRVLGNLEEEYLAKYARAALYESYPKGDMDTHAQDAKILREAIRMTQHDDPGDRLAAMCKAQTYLCDKELIDMNHGIITPKGTWER